MPVTRNMPDCKRQTFPQGTDALQAAQATRDSDKKKEDEREAYPESCRSIPTNQRYTNKKIPGALTTPGILNKTATTYSPTVCSTIGVTKLNFSVRNGKRWNLRAIVT